MKITAKETTIVENLISEKMKDISKSKIKQWIKFEQLTLNGSLVKRLDEAVAPGDVLEFSPHNDPAKGKIFKPEFKILFEDRYLIAGLKPAGILSIGEASEKNPSFIKLVQNYLRQNSKGRENAYIIHRLDREVSGILLLAKSEALQQEIKDHWKENTKAYYALVEGKVAQAEGRIESELAEDPQTLKVYSVPQAEEGKTKHAVTHYKVLQEFKDKTLLEVRLETGRKNQIRVHLSEMGHPIVGDWRYGADDRFERQIRLFAYQLKFKHPKTGEWVEIKLPLPANFLHLPPKHERYK